MERMGRKGKQDGEKRNFGKKKNKLKGGKGAAEESGAPERIKSGQIATI